MLKCFGRCLAALGRAKNGVLSVERLSGLGWARFQVTNKHHWGVRIESQSVRIEDENFQLVQIDPSDWASVVAKCQGSSVNPGSEVFLAMGRLCNPVVVASVRKTCKPIEIDDTPFPRWQGVTEQLDEARNQHKPLTNVNVCYLYDAFFMAKQIGTAALLSINPKDNMDPIRIDCETPEVTMTAVVMPMRW